MKHTQSKFYFQSKDDQWIVEYYYSISEYGSECISARVFLNEDLYHEFGNRLPNTRTENPTKSQAKEIITAAKKIKK